MKKLISAAVLFALVLSFAACGAAPSSSAAAGTSQAASSAAGAAMPADMPWSHVEPLAEPVTLNVALLANTLPHLPTYIAQEKGWLGAVGIEVSPVVFKNGPSMTEAMGAGAWDCGSTGIGGVITGVLNQDMKIIGVAARDEGGFQAFFARPDSPIVEAGKGHGAIPELYGTADTWRGQEILCAVGTTNQFLLYKTLEKDVYKRQHIPAERDAPAFCCKAIYVRPYRVHLPGAARTRTRGVSLAVWNSARRIGCPAYKALPTCRQRQWPADRHRNQRANVPPDKCGFCR